MHTKNPYDPKSFASFEWDNCVRDPRRPMEILELQIREGHIIMTAEERVKVAVAIQFLACHFGVEDRFIKPQPATA